MEKEIEHLESKYAIDEHFEKMEKEDKETFEQPCLVEQAMEELKRLGKPDHSICISCRCPKCSLRCWKIKNNQNGNNRSP